MGLIDDKKNVFTTIGSYVSLIESKIGSYVSLIKSTELPDTSNLFPSINNKNDIGSFLIDTLGVVVGTTGIKDLVGELFTNFVDKAELTLKTSIKNQLIDFNSGNDLPNDFINMGIDVQVKDIDINGILKNNPTSSRGSLIFGDNVNSFSRKVYNAIQNEDNFIDYEGTLLIKYNSLNDILTFKLPTTYTNSNIGEWMGDLVDKTEFLNKKEFTTKILDRLFGTVTETGDKTIDEIYGELRINSLIQKIIDGDDNIEISDIDIAELYEIATQLQSGSIKYDMGCGPLNSELLYDRLYQLINNINDSNDPNYTSNIINDAISDSFNDTDIDGVSDENEETIKNGFFNKLIQFLQLELSKLLVTSPQARMLLAISSSFQNNGVPNIGNPEEDLMKFRSYIKCLIKEALALLYEFIFNLIVTELLKLLVPIIKQIIKEKINAYIGVVKSLISSKI